MLRAPSEELYHSMAIMGARLIILVILAFATTNSLWSQNHNYSISSKNRATESNEPIRDTVSHFYMNDAYYHTKITDSIAVSATAQRVNAFGKYYRVRIELANLRDKDITLLTRNIEAYSGEGRKRAILKIMTLDDYMRKIRLRRFVLGDGSNYIDNPEMIIYPINRDDISNYAVESRTILGYKANTTTDIDRAYADGNTALYKLRIERNYIRSNTLNPNEGVTGIILIKRGYEPEGGLLTIDITISGRKFRFEWSYEDIEDVKYY